MSGLKRLTWVSALTLAGLLLSASAVSVVASDHHAQERGRGQARGQEHRQQAPGHHRGGVEAESGLRLVTPPAVVTPPGRVTPPGHLEDDERPGWGCGDDNHEHVGPPGHPDMASPCDRGRGPDDQDDSNDHESRGRQREQGRDDD